MPSPTSSLSPASLPRINARIRRLTRELHRQLARYLEESFDVVLLPAFESSTMVNKKRGRRIGSRTARAMLTWGHFKFRQHMLQKAEAAGTRFHVEIVSEAYTSKTCGACGALHTAGRGESLPLPQHRVRRDT